MIQDRARLEHPLLGYSVSVPNRQPIIHGERRGTGHVRDFVTPSRNPKCFPSALLPANGYSNVMRER